MIAVKNWLINQVLDLTSRYFQLKAYLGLNHIENGFNCYYEYKDTPLSGVIHPLERLKAVETFDDFRPDDLLVYTYPKAGTHFVSDIVRSIQFETGLISDRKFGINAVVPLELITPADKAGPPDDPLKSLKTLEDPRLFMSHLPWSMLPPKVKSHQVKVIHCIRNPKDIIGSAFAFLKKTSTVARYATWNEFIEAYISGKMIYGDYFNFLREWYPYRQSENQLVLYYEDLVTDLKAGVQAIAKFLDVELTEAQINSIVDHHKFKNVRIRLGDNFLYRKGQIGSWESELTVEQNRRVDEWISKNSHGLEDLKLMFT